MPPGIGYDNPHQDALQRQFKISGPGLPNSEWPGYQMPVAGAPDLGTRMPNQPYQDPSFSGPPLPGPGEPFPGPIFTLQGQAGVGDRDQLTWGNTGHMRGFEVGSDYGGDTKARNSVKNTFGRIASRYSHAPGSIDQILQDADFQKYFPNARKVAGGAGDKIDFGGVLSDFESGVPVGVVDVLEYSDPTSNSSRGWQWLDEANAGGGMGGGPSGGAVAGMTPGGGQSDLMQQILESLQQQTMGTADPQKLLLQQMSGGR